MFGISKTYGVYLLSPDVKVFRKTFGKEVNSKNNNQKHESNTECHAEFSLRRTQIQLDRKGSSRLDNFLHASEQIRRQNLRASRGKK